MFDMHCHILWGIDDGAKNFLVARNMCELSQKHGIKYIVATPHFIIDEMEQSNELLINNIRIINDWCKDADIKVKVFLGCESYIHPLLPQYVNEGKIPTINSSRYLLVEFPMDEIPIYAEDVLYQLMIKGIVPVIAHPERYSYFRDNPQQLHRMVQSGCVIQCNCGSFLGHFGKSIKNYSFKLLKHNMVHIIGSDCHNDFREQCGVSLKEACKVIKEANIGDISLEMMMDNSYRIIADKELGYVEAISFEKDKKIRGLFSKFLKF